MDKTILNAVVTLRNQVSPWLMILQVVPDGWEFPAYVPGQIASLGLFGSASRCALAEPEKLPADPDKLIKRAYSIASSFGFRKRRLARLPSTNRECPRASMWSLSPPAPGLHRS